MLYCGPSSRNYPTRVDVGNTDTYTIGTLTAGATSFCAVTAYDSSKVESDYSNELSVVVPSSPPVVGFSASPASGTAPLTVAFTNTTTGQVTTWVWDFGDGTTSTAQNPTHVYGAAGTYKPVLTATGPGGSMSKTAATAISVVVPAAPVVSFGASPGSGAAPLTVAFNNTTTGQVTSWAWNFGDGTTSIVKNPTHVYNAPGSYTATLTATGPGGAASKAAATAIVVSATSSSDTTPPSTPASLSVAAVSSAQINLAWTASSDSVGVTGYRIERCPGTGCTNFTALTATSSATTLSDAGLAPATTYRYRVRAADAAGNLSGYSSIGSATTQAAAGTIPPTVPTDLVGYWTFNEGSGTTAQDSAGSHPGTLGSGPLWVPGKLGQALSFDGVDDFVDLGTLDVSGSALTIAAWIKADSFATDARILSKSVGSAEQDHYFMLSTIDNDGIKLRFRLKTGTTTSTLLASSGTLAVGQWIHVAAVYNGSAMILYQDGVEVGRVAKSGVIATNATTRVAIGRNPQAYGAFDGTIDDVRVYARALSTSEVQALIR
jgi:PKD repeat protein